MTVAKAGGPPAVLASGLSFPSGNCCGWDSVYWTSYGDGTVRKVPIAGGPVSVLAFGQNTPSGVTVDATSIYWLNSTTVMKLAK
jgi:hypothetical protein